MQHRVAVVTGACLSLALSAPGSGQSVNIDFGSQNGAPPGGYAAAGLAGHWNVLDGPVDVPVLLDDLDGNPTPVSIVIENAFDTLGDVPLAHPELGDDRPLLNDGILGAFGPKIPLEVRIAGLEPGVYRLITYTWYWPVEAFAQVVFVDASPFVHPAGGPWPGALALGVTHMEHVVQLPSPAAADVLAFSLVGDGPGSFFNGALLLEGIQLWKIDTPPCPTDVDGDGATATSDLLALLADWGACPGCATDIDGDGSVGTSDLLTLLAGWGPCPGTMPASCADPGLGDCYAVHAAPGCDEPACCAAVCALDPWCCDVAWDGLCAGRANLTAQCTQAIHPNCGSAESGSCFEAGFIQGCDDPACCQTVCALDPFCCRYAWDLVCKEQAELFCSKIPAGCGHPEAGDCFDAIGPDQNFTPYCDDAACCEAVCAIDAFCCQTLWDETCVARANAVCAGGACGPGAGDCFTVHAGGGCDDTDCCFQVCSVVPNCCEDQLQGGGWDANCVAWAGILCAPE